MIVRQEEKTIRRVLNTLKEFIDCLSILDTGSTDNTLNEIKNWCMENNIKNHLESSKFVDFGYSRTESYNIAKKQYPDVDYYMLSDSDFCWVFSKDFNKENFSTYLKNLNYPEELLIAQKTNHGLLYYNIRFLNSKKDWKCYGTTHEYWGTLDKSHVNKHYIDDNMIYINDINDGGCKHDKFERDIRLLTKGLEEEKDNGLIQRYHFYIANSYKNNNNPLKALEHYKQVIEHTFWKAEVYMAIVYSIQCYVILMNEIKNHNISKMVTFDNYNKDVEKYYNYYLEIFNLGFYSIKISPNRIEALYYLAKKCEDDNLYDLAYEIYYHIKDYKISNIDKNDALFIESNIYNYEVYFRLSIISYYIGELKGGLFYINKILSNPNLPEKIISITKNNKKFYS